MSETQQLNLRLTPQHAELVRLFAQRLRESGPSYEREARLFLLEPWQPRYMSIRELDRRFGEILRRLAVLERAQGLAPVEEDAERTTSSEDHADG